MSKAILISINPNPCCDILNLIKDWEMRTTAPKEWLDYLYGITSVKPKPRKCYIYCTSHKNYHKSLYIVCEEDGGGYDVDYYNPCCLEDEDERDFLLNSQVVAEFTLNEVYPFFLTDKRSWNDEGFRTLFWEHAHLTLEKLHKYVGEKAFYAWEISNLYVYDKPKEISEFRKPSTFSLEQLREFGLPYTEEMYKDMTTKGKWFLTRAPQSWCYVLD